MCVFGTVEMRCAFKSERGVHRLRPPGVPPAPPAPPAGPGLIKQPSELREKGRPGLMLSTSAVSSKFIPTRCAKGGFLNRTLAFR